ncbi:hemerythrin domain-containing protein [Catellatospora methionotrophica]|uniref:hemerythrin domain-containing protein n=1 Tax=Catellatospora methionotrophica TaxID=121620 RepID=UPI0033DF0CE2
MASPHGDRTVAFSLQLQRAHQELRRRVREIRANIGDRTLPDDVLAHHCLAFCSALTEHHRGEDEGMFADVLRARPDLAPTVAKLVEDHGWITSILTRVDSLATRAAQSPGADLEAIGRELDGLTAIMDSHFNFEERVLSAALDRDTADSGWSGTVFRSGLSDRPGQRAEDRT